MLHDVFVSVFVTQVHDSSFCKVKECQSLNTSARVFLAVLLSKVWPAEHCWHSQDVCWTLVPEPTSGQVKICSVAVSADNYLMTGDKNVQPSE